MVVTNGGGPLKGGAAPSITFVDMKSEKLLDEVKLSAPRYNAGHIAVSPQGDIALVSAPRAGLPGKSTKLGAVSLKPNGKAITTMRKPKKVVERMKGETLSVLINEAERLAFATHPEGDMLTVWSIEHGKLVRKYDDFEQPRSICAPWTRSTTLWGTPSVTAWPCRLSRSPPVMSCPKCASLRRTSAARTSSPCSVQPACYNQRVIARRPLTDALLFPVSAGIGAMAAAITVMKELGWEIEAMTMSSEAFWAQPWRMVASILPHGDFIHLLFNLYWLWIFGSIVEEAFGHVRTLAMVTLFAVGSSAAEYAVFDGGIGLSGVGYGLFGLLYVLNKRDPRFDHAMDKNTGMLFIIWFFVCIALTYFDIMPIANVAHGVGGVLGALAGLALAKPMRATSAFRADDKPDSMSLVGYAGFAAVLGLSLVGATTFRGTVNLSGNVDLEFHRAAMKALEKKDHDSAVTMLQKAIEADPDDARNWYNLGVTYIRMNKPKEADSCFARAYELKPDDERYRAAATGE